MLRVALYIRVSTEEQKIHGLSVETQKEALAKWAKDNNCEIVDYYVDAGKTARKNLSSRLEMHRLLEDVKANQIDLIIFTKLDRWFRNVRDYHKVQEILEKHNVNWKTIFENYDTLTANGRLHINIMLSVAQDEADRTSERIKVVFQNKLKNGEAISGSLPMGYKISEKKVVVNEETASIAIDIFESYQIHQSQTKVFKDIANKYGLHLCDKTIYRLLRNPIYIGTYRGKKDFCPPLISKQKFDEVQEILRTRNIRYAPTERVFLFTGLLECSECKHIMVANAQIREYRSGRKEYSMYNCRQHYQRHLCSHNKIIYEHKIEEFLLRELDGAIYKEIQDRTRNFQMIGQAEKKHKSNKAAAKKKLEKLKELYVNDLIDLDAYKTDYEKYTSILNEEDQQEEKRDTSALEKFVQSGYKSMYGDITKENKRALWRTIIKKIVIGADNNMTIVFYR
jgi:site-specific DNA recombinase